MIRKGLETSILLDDAPGAGCLRINARILLGWIRYQKVRYLQNRNPGVPGIIYKLEAENAGIRKLQNAKEAVDNGYGSERDPGYIQWAAVK